MSTRPRLNVPVDRPQLEQPSITKPLIDVPPVRRLPSMPLELSQLGVIVYVLRPQIEGRPRLSYGGAQPIVAGGHVPERLAKLRGAVYDDLSQLIDACYAACGVVQNVVKDKPVRPSLLNVSLRAKNGNGNGKEPTPSRPRLNATAVNPPPRKILRGRP